MDVQVDGCNLRLVSNLKCIKRQRLRNANFIAKRGDGFLWHVTLGTCVLVG